jgi:hypothetical protein
MSNNFNDFFEDADNTNDKVKTGDISAITRWPETEGTCLLKAIKLESPAGNNLLRFILLHPNFGMGSFCVFLPKKSHKDYAKIKRMEQIYATLFSAYNLDAEKYNVSDAYKHSLKQPAIEVEYRLENIERENSRNGEVYTQQDLIILRPIKQTQSSSSFEDDVPF